MKYFKRQYRAQYIAAISASLIMLASGTNFGWASPSVQKLSSPNSAIPITPLQASWIASFGSLGGLIGPLVGALLANWLGRKPAILFIAIPFIISWILVAIATQVEYLYGSRLIGGLSVTASMTVLPMYLSEIATPAIRGVLGMFNMIFLHFGIFLQYSTIPYLSLQTNALISMSVPILLLITFIWMPETPYFLQMKNRPESTEGSLRRLRDCDDDDKIEKEFSLVRRTIEKQAEEKGRFVDLIRTSANRRAMIVVIGTMSAQQLSGISAISSYAHLIFESSNSKLSPAISGIIMEPLSLLSAIPCVFLVDSLGRKSLLMASCLLITIPLTILGAFFYLQSIKYSNIESIDLLPLISLFVYKFCFLLGLGSIPHILVGELFPTSVGVLASCVAGIFSAFVAFLIPQIYYWIEDSFQLYLVFWVFAGFCLMSSIFVWFFVPETKGKPFIDIQRMMKGEIISNESSLSTSS